MWESCDWRGSGWAEWQVFVARGNTGAKLSPVHLPKTGVVFSKDRWFSGFPSAVLGKAVDAVDTLPLFEKNATLYFLPCPSGMAVGGDCPTTSVSHWC